MDIQAYWEAVLAQDPVRMSAFFHADAQVIWHNTRECFTAEEFIKVNCAYPGDWQGRIERIVQAESVLVTAVHVWSLDGRVSDHATSFITLCDGKIIALDEYWGNDGPIPDWRRDLGLGRVLNGDDE